VIAIAMITVPNALGVNAVARGKDCRDAVGNGPVKPEISTTNCTAQFRFVDIEAQ
jgi:hypothetical protein